MLSDPGSSPSREPPRDDMVTHIENISRLVRRRGGNQRLGRKRSEGSRAPAQPGVRDSDETLTDQAYRRIEELIVSLQVAPGSLLSEPELTERLQIGRTPIREALQRLAREKLVVILPRRGMFVTEINVHSQLRLLEFRRESDRLLARLAARRASLRDRTTLEEIATAMERAAAKNDESAFMREDMRLNDVIAASARNEYAADSMKLWNGLSRRFWYQHYKSVADMPLAAGVHADLARAIARADEDEAAKASDRLLDYLEDFTKATVEDPSPAHLPPRKRTS